MLTLFRVLELDGGSISIDGQDIAHLGLSQLRKAIAMLPQDPVRAHALSSDGVWSLKFGAGRRRCSRVLFARTSSKMVTLSRFVRCPSR